MVRQWALPGILGMMVSGATNAAAFPLWDNAQVRRNANPADGGPADGNPPESVGGLNSGPAAADARMLDGALHSTRAHARWSSWAVWYARRTREGNFQPGERTMLESYIRGGTVGGAPGMAGGLPEFALMGNQYHPGTLFNALA